MKVGDKVFCKDDFGEFTGWISYINDNRPYPYYVAKDKGYIGKTSEIYKLEHLTLLEDDPCQYCNLTKRELKMVQSELRDAYAMLQNRDKKIKELERELKYYETK